MAWHYRHVSIKGEGGLLRDAASKQSSAITNANVMISPRLQKTLKYKTLLCYKKRVPLSGAPFYSFPGLLSYPAVKIDTKKVTMTPIMMIVFTVSPPLQFFRAARVWMILLFSLL
ncbi:hypothetical protein [Bacillus vallismortis]|uniref:hypothetical protein n=1 Tax=Bacillus vallismortis TaxID=72361 RepID=UPI002090588D|nr:hypothetical protein [Bacillus vallismortis]MCO4851542.1 hypothetical protein [Bacillus vallismortis]